MKKFSPEQAEKYIHTQFIKRWLDLILLAQLKETPRLNGYCLLVQSRIRFGETLSSGTVYYVLSKMEQDGLIKASKIGDITVYELTKSGEEVLNAFRNTYFTMTPSVFGIIKNDW